MSSLFRKSVFPKLALQKCTNINTNKLTKMNADPLQFVYIVVISNLDETDVLNTVYE